MDCITTPQTSQWTCMERNAHHGKACIVIYLVKYQLSTFSPNFSEALLYSVYMTDYIIIYIQAWLPVQRNRWETAKLYGFDSVYDIIYSM